MEPNKGAGPAYSSKSGSWPRVCVQIKELAQCMQPNQRVGLVYASKSKSWLSVCNEIKELSQSSVCNEIKELAQSSACTQIKELAQSSVCTQIKELAQCMQPNQGADPVYAPKSRSWLSVWIQIKKLAPGAHPNQGIGCTMLCRLATVVKTIRTSASTRLRNSCNNRGRHEWSSI